MLEVEDILYAKTLRLSSHSYQSTSGPDEPRASNRVTQKRNPSANHCSFSDVVEAPGHRSSNDEQFIRGFADSFSVCVHDSEGRRDKLAMQSRQRSGDVWMDRLLFRRRDCHRIAVVDDDADYVGILDLDGCKSGMYLESFSTDSSKYTDTFLPRKSEQDEMHSFQ